MLAHPGTRACHLLDLSIRATAHATRAAKKSELRPNPTPVKNYFRLLKSQGPGTAPRPALNPDTLCVTPGRAPGTQTLNFLVTSNVSSPAHAAQMLRRMHKSISFMNVLGSNQFEQYPDADRRSPSSPRSEMADVALIFQLPERAWALILAAFEIPLPAARHF